MLIYGFHAVLAQIKTNSQEIQKLWVQEEKKEARLNDLLKLAQTNHIAIESTHKKNLDQMTENSVHQGVVCLVNSETDLQSHDLNSIIELSLKQNQLILALDGITDPHNLGACLRSADAFQVDAVIIPKDRSAQLSATVHKVSCGASQTIPVLPVSNLAQTLKSLKAKGFWTYGLDGAAEESLFALEFIRPTVLVLGAEDTGLRRLSKENCDFLVKIPMQGQIESLNVSVAAGISLFEISRQRALQLT